MSESSEKQGSIAPKLKRRERSVSESSEEQDEWCERVLQYRFPSADQGAQAVPFLNQPVGRGGPPPPPPPILPLATQATALLNANRAVLMAARQAVVPGDNELLADQKALGSQILTLTQNMNGGNYRAALDTMPTAVALANKILGKASGGQAAEQKVPQHKSEKTPLQPPTQPVATPQKVVQQQQAPQLDPAMVARAKAAMDQFRTLLQTAAAVVPTSPAETAAQRDFVSQNTKLLSHEQAGNPSAVLATLPRVVGLARKVLALHDTAQVPAKQLSEQKSQYDGMKGVCADVVRTYFSPTAAASVSGIQMENLEAGKYFSAYMAALDNVEQSKRNLPSIGPIPPKFAQATKQCCEALITAGQDCLANLSKDKGGSKEAKRKLQIVSEGIKAARHMAIAMELAMIGEPTAQRPWDRETEQRAGGLQAAMSFETGYKRGSNLKETGSAGASDTFWVEAIPPGGQKATKNFIFKPVRGERSPAAADVPGSGAAKEALASANGKLFERQTGISLGVPETYVTTIGAYALDLKGPEDDGQPRIGSLQAFAPSGGALGVAAPEILRKIPPKECQKVAIQDIMSLNFDRHSGNLLLNTPPGGTPELVPIDHGGTLPTRKDFDAMRQRVGGLQLLPSKTVKVQNATLGLPGAYKNFDDETLAKLDLLDPNAMVQGMKDHLAALDKVNPGLNAQQKVAPESLQMSKRAMMFMKAAARELSPAEIQIALGQHGGALFDAQDAQFDDVADRIIAEMKPKKAAYEEIFTTSGQRRDDIFKTLEMNGWTPANGDLAGWVMADPTAALTLYKADAKHPALPQPGSGQQSANGSGLRATTQQIATAKGGLDPNKVIRQSVTTLVNRGTSHLASAADSDATRLLKMQQDIARLMSVGQSAAAEDMARDFEEQALHAGLKNLRIQADALYATRDSFFAGMGTDEEERAKRDKASGSKRDFIFRRLHRRINFDADYQKLQAMTAFGADIAEARMALASMKKRLEPL